MSNVLAQPCTILKGVGACVENKLEQLGISSIGDLLLHFPRRYEDRTHLTSIENCRPGSAYLIEGTIIDSRLQYGGKRSLICKMADETGVIQLRWFYFNAHQMKQLSVGSRVRCYGESRLIGRELGIIHPTYDVIRPEKALPLATTLTPVYPAISGVSQKIITKLIRQALHLLGNENSATEILPDSLSNHLSLPSFFEAIENLHQPPCDQSESIIKQSKQRLAFEELMAHNSLLRQVRLKTQRFSAITLSKPTELLNAFHKQLPFDLTHAQQRAVNEIADDLSRNKPMLRLLQGDVGSGKTVVAAIAALFAVEKNTQVAIMAPTELLAEQHYQQFAKWFGSLGISVSLLTSKMKAADRRVALNEIAENKVQVVVGTHALFQNSVAFSQLSLVIVDEQHRFGVEQRLSLMSKGVDAKQYPHQLIMTATPIPRTLAMTIYADLDYSVIDELPPGRTPIKTVAMTNAKRADVIERVRVHCQQGNQAYWVCTLIDESEKLQNQAATDIVERLRNDMPELIVGLVHGRMNSAEKDAQMMAFRQGDANVLVATTVIEVGVNVPNASLMIIENAERMGLSQLHQLRGRVGRGAKQSFCVLLYQQPLSEIAQTRIDVLRQTTDGFEIAKQDLNLRGPGEILGTKQTGLMSFKVADLMRDQGLLAKVKEAVDKMLLEAPERMQELVERWLPGDAELGNV